MLHKGCKLCSICYSEDLLHSVLVHNKINWQKTGRIFLAEAKMAFHVLLGNTASKSLSANHLR